MRVIWIAAVLCVGLLLIGASYVFIFPSLTTDESQGQLAAVINPFVDEATPGPVDLMTWEQSSASSSNNRSADAGSDGPAIRQTEISPGVSSSDTDEQGLTESIKVEGPSDDTISADGDKQHSTGGKEANAPLDRDRFDELAYTEMLKMAKTIGSAEEATQEEPLVNRPFGLNYSKEKMVSVIHEGLIKKPSQSGLPEVLSGDDAGTLPSNPENVSANSPESANRDVAGTSLATKSKKSAVVVEGAGRDSGWNSQSHNSQSHNRSANTNDSAPGDATEPSQNQNKQENDANRAMKAALRAKYLDASEAIDAYPEGDEVLSMSTRQKDRLNLPYSGNDKIAIIVHRGNDDTISIADLKNIYLDRITHWDNGANIALYNLPLDDRWREVFSQSILNMSALDAANAESNRAITNKVGNLSHTKKVNLVVSYVARNPNAIAYVPLSMLRENTRVKVVMTLP